MRRPRLVLLAGACATMVGGWIAACGSPTATASTTASTATAGSAGSTGSGSMGGGPALASPPPPGPTSAPDGTTNVTFALRKLYLGDTDPDGTPDVADGWKHYGYNIDGVPASDLGAFCMPRNNASPASLHQEGIDGIENSFGHNVLPIILGLSADASQKINLSIATGAFSFLFTLDDLGAGPNYNPIASQLAQTGNLGASPKFDGTDPWPVVEGSIVSLPAAYLVGDTWVSGPTSAALVALPLPPAGASLTLNIEHARVSMKLDPTHTNVTGGIISGILGTDALIAQIQKLAGVYGPSLCDGPTIAPILAQLARASDILLDGTQDPGKTCDGISIGLGFDAAADQRGPMVAAPPPPPDPCAP